MKLALALIAAVSIVGVATPSAAQVISASQVLSDCPDVPRAQACPPLAAGFLGDEAPSAGRDQQIVDLVVAIAEAAQQNNVPRRACLNAADGIRILATGLSTAEKSAQIRDIADALCAGTSTASLGNGGFTFSVPQSLSEQSSGGAGTVTVASSAPAGDGEPEITETASATEPETTEPEITEPETTEPETTEPEVTEPETTEPETTEPETEEPDEMPPQAACQNPPCNEVKPDKPPKPPKP